MRPPLSTDLQGDKWEQNYWRAFAVTHWHWWHRHFHKVSLSKCQIQVPYVKAYRRPWYTLSHARWQSEVLTFACLMLDPRGNNLEVMRTVDEKRLTENKWQHGGLINLKSRMELKERHCKRWFEDEGSNIKVTISAWWSSCCRWSEMSWCVFVHPCDICGCDIRLIFCSISTTVHVPWECCRQTNLHFISAGLFLILHNHQLYGALQSCQEEKPLNRIWSDISQRLTVWL